LLEKTKTLLGSILKVAFWGTSGGALALRLPGKRLAAVVAWEPATILVMGILPTLPDDGRNNYSAVLKDPASFYTEERQNEFRKKIAKIHCPVS
jgi:hypothetical protein